MKDLRKYLPNFIIITTVSILWITTFLYILRPYMVEGFSMNPTLKTGDYILVFQHNTTIHRRDLVVFEQPGDKKMVDVKRVWGLPGDVVAICNGNLFINGKIEKNALGFSIYDNLSKLILSQDEFFVLGENIGVSVDSRHFGAVPLKNIVGKPILLYLPFSRFGVLK